MRNYHLTLWLFGLLPMLACGPNSDGGDLLPDGDPPSDEDQLPETIPGDWFTDVQGSVLNRKEYVSGALEGDSCTETFEFAGLNVTDVLPENCETCDLSYTFYLNLIEKTDCLGGDDLDEEGKMAFELDQENNEAVLYWYSEGWWNSEWVEVGTGTLIRDDEALAFDFQLDWDDQDNGEWAGNWTADSPCSWSDTCSWNGFYSSNIAISFEWIEDDSSAR